MRGLSKSQYFYAFGALAFIYSVAGKLCLRFAFFHPSASPIWLPSGIALAAFLIWGYRLWPAVFIGAFIVNITTFGSVLSSLGVATGNTLEALAAAYLVNCFAHGIEAFDRAEDVLKYVALAGFLSTTISPTLGVTSLALTDFAHWDQYIPVWATWWLGDAGGNIVAAPLLILLWGRPWTEKLVRAKILEATFLVTLLSGLALTVFDGLVFSKAAKFPLEFVCIPPVIWIAYRLGQRATATAVFLLSSIAFWGTLHGYGPFASHNPNVSALLMAAFMGVIAIMGMILSAVVSEREGGEGALRSAPNASKVTRPRRSSAATSPFFLLPRRSPMERRTANCDASVRRDACRMSASAFGKMGRHFGRM